MIIKNFKEIDLIKLLSLEMIKLNKDEKATIIYSKNSFKYQYNEGEYLESGTKYSIWIDKEKYFYSLFHNLYRFFIFDNNNCKTVEVDLINNKFTLSKRLPIENKEIINKLKEIINTMNNIIKKEK